MFKRLQGWLVDTDCRLVLSLVTLDRTVNKNFRQTVVSMNTVVTVAPFVCRSVVIAWLAVACFYVLAFAILELLLNFLLEAVLVGRNRGFIEGSLNADAHFLVFLLVGTNMCRIGAASAVVRDTVLFRVLGHLLAANDLPKALISLLFEKNLRLGATYEDLTNELRIFDDILLTTAFSSCIVLCLCSSALAALTAVFHEDVTILETLRTGLSIKLLPFVKFVVFQ